MLFIDDVVHGSIITLTIIDCRRMDSNKRHDFTSVVGFEWET